MTIPLSIIHLCTPAHSVNSTSAHTPVYRVKYAYQSQCCLRCHLVDECLSNPCYNGGTCHSQVSGGFYCTCPPSCAGTRCEVKDTHVCFLPLNKGTGNNILMIM